MAKSCACQEKQGNCSPTKNCGGAKMGYLVFEPFGIHKNNFGPNQNRDRYKRDQVPVLVGRHWSCLSLLLFRCLERLVRSLIYFPL